MFWIEKDTAREENNKGEQFAIVDPSVSALAQKGLLERFTVQHNDKNASIFNPGGTTPHPDAVCRPNWLPACAGSGFELKIELGLLTPDPLVVALPTTKFSSVDFPWPCRPQKEATAISPSI
jgi:hypothetical protein